MPSGPDAEKQLPFTPLRPSLPAECGEVNCSCQPRIAACDPVYEAGDGTRTRDPLLGKQMLYQLSYSRMADPAST